MGELNEHTLRKLKHGDTIVYKKIEFIAVPHVTKQCTGCLLFPDKFDYEHHCSWLNDIDLTTYEHECHTMLIPNTERALAKYVMRRITGEDE